MIQPSVVLLDVEGTTTPIDFVFKTLFPYARQHVGDFLSAHATEPDVQSAIKRALEEYHSDRDAAMDREHLRPQWSDPDSISQAADYLRWLIDRDVKSPALKSLQGMIWQQGYDDGSLRGEVYPDVPVAMARWKSEGRRVAIYSSGSVLAQKLLFRTTEYGDLTTLIDLHFDTAVGAKREAASYARIARELDAPAAEILFISDIVAELDAAKDAGMKTVLSVRPGMAEPDAACGHRVAHDFDEALATSARS